MILTVIILVISIVIFLAELSALVTLIWVRKNSLQLANGRPPEQKKRLKRMTSSKIIALAIFFLVMTGFFLCFLWWYSVNRLGIYDIVIKIGVFSIIGVASSIFGIAKIYGGMPRVDNMHQPKKNKKNNWLV